MVDERVFASRGVAMMMSGNHPTPELPTIGMEIDTGNVFSFTNSTNVWAPVGNSGVLLGYGGGPLGDISGWTDQVTINFNLAVATTVCAVSTIVGTQITSSSLAHVNRVNVDGSLFELGRDRQVPQNDPSAISGSWIGVLQPGAHTITNTAYATPGSGAWRLSKAALMIFGF
jgi:hypothetical protein